MNKAYMIRYVKAMIQLVEENKEYFLDGFDNDMSVAFNKILKYLEEENK